MSDVFFQKHAFERGLLSRRTTGYSLDAPLAHKHHPLSAIHYHKFTLDRTLDWFFRQHIEPLGALLREDEE